jgi:hypothetical protein
MDISKTEIIQLKDMLQNNFALSLDNYFKCLITLAYELLLQGEESTAQLFIEEIPLSYIKNHLGQQLQADPLFKLSFLAFLDLAHQKGWSPKIINNFNKLVVPAQP